MIGTQLGKNYKVLEKLDEGGMGVVYLVEHQTLHKHFAAKVLAASLAANQEAVQRFEIEAHAASKLEHENIVSVTDYGVAEDGRPYLVMERLKGQPLSRRIAQGPLTLEETVAVIVPVCHALSAAHEAGFVHRDVKPENIFLTQRSIGGFGVKVLDFGLTRVSGGTTRVTKMGHALGSPLYMSPEMCRGNEVDSRSDIYSLGVLLYQLACGQLPFSDDNLLKVLHLHTFEAPPAPRSVQPDLSPELERVIVTALVKDPAARYQTIDDFEEDLMSVLPPGADVLLNSRRTPLPIRLPTSQPSIAVRNRSALTQMATLPELPAVVSEPKIATSVAAMPTPAPAPVAPPRRRGLLIGAGVLLLGALGLTFYLTRSTPAARAPAPAPPPPVAAAQPAVAPIVPPAPPPLPPQPAPTIRLQVHTEPAAARVELDGELLGTTPLDVAVPRRDGPHVLAISAEGYQRVERTIAGSDLDVALTLSPVVTAPPPKHARKTPRHSDPSTQSPSAPDETLDIRGAR